MSSNLFSIFEQSNQILEDDGNDYSNDEFELQTPEMITPYSYPTEDNYILLRSSNSQLTWTMLDPNFFL